jgi:hypothetical protein
MSESRRSSLWPASSPTRVKGPFTRPPISTCTHALAKADCRGLVGLNRPRSSQSLNSSTCTGDLQAARNLNSGARYRTVRQPPNEGCAPSDAEALVCLLGRPPGLLGRRWSR